VYYGQGVHAALVLSLTVLPVHGVKATATGATGATGLTIHDLLDGSGDYPKVQKVHLPSKVRIYSPTQVSA